MNNQTVIFSLRIEDANLATRLQIFRDNLKQIQREMKLVDESSVAFKHLFQEASNTRLEISKLTAQQKALNQEIKNTGVAADSLVGLQTQYSKLTAQVSKLSAAERESINGQQLIKKAQGLKTQINGIEQSMGRFTGQVGNYQQALSGLGQAFGATFATGGIIGAVTLITSALIDGEKAAIDYEQGLADLAALTGARGEQLKGLENVAKGLEDISVKGQKIVTVGVDIERALTLVGGAQPELLKDAEALGKVTENAIILAKASGDGLEPSVKALTTTLGQFQKDARESADVINVLAAGAKEGSIEIPALTRILAQAGEVAKLSGLSLEETVAAIETLGKAKIPEAQIGTQFRNILLALDDAQNLPDKAQEAFKRFGINTKILSDQTLTFSQRLKELSKFNGDLPGLNAVFEQRSVASAAALTTLGATFDELLPKVTATNEAFDQAAIKANTSKTSIENLSATFKNELRDEVDGSTGSIRIFADITSFLIDKMGLLKGALNLILGPLASFVASAKNAFQQTKDFLGLSAPRNLNPGADNRTSLDPFAGTGATDLQTKTKAALEQQTRDRIALNAAQEEANILQDKADKIQEKAAAKRGREAAKREREHEAEIKAINDQIKRIGDLQEEVQKLDSQTVINDFDRKEIEITAQKLVALNKLKEQQLALDEKIRKRGGKATAGDKTEAGLISEQTASVIAAYQVQFDEVAKARQKAQDDQLTQLRAAQLEVLEIQVDNAEKTAQAEADAINRSFAEVKRALDQTRDQKLLVLQEELNRGEITRTEFQKQSLKIQKDFADASLKAEIQHKNDAIAVAEQLRDAKIAAAKAALVGQLNSIDAAAASDISGITEGGAKRGLDPGKIAEQISAREQKAIADRIAAQQKYEKTVADATASATDVQLAGIDAVDAAKKDSDKLDADLVEEQKKRRKELADFGISVAETISNAVFQIERNRLESQTSDELNALEAQYNQRKSKAGLTAEQLAKIDKQYQKEKEQIEKAAAEKRKRIAITEAVIQGALAVVKALPNVFAAIAAGVAAAAQIAIISSQKFARGGTVKMGTFGGRPHSQGGTVGQFSDGTRIEVEKDEDFIILNKRASHLRKVYSDLNYSTGGNRFAGGGIADIQPQFGPASGSASAGVVVLNSGWTDEQAKAVAKIVAVEVAAATKQAVADGDNENRLNERRKTALQSNTNV